MVWENFCKMNSGLQQVFTYTNGLCISDATIVISYIVIIMIETFHDGQKKAIKTQII